MIFESYKRYFLAGIRWLILLVLLDISTQGCKKFVQIGPPVTQLVTTSVFNNNATATSALTAIYTNMFGNSESYSLGQNLGLLADELTNYSTSATQVQFYTNAMIATNSIYGEWANAYNYIYQANAIISALQGNGNITAAVAQQLTGEALFIRAFWHFYLTNEYGDVPLVTTTLYTVNESISRTPQAQVYAQIILDLQNAQALLNTNYVDATDTTVTTERVRPTKSAAQALLARAYLYTERYDSAETYASLVIGNSLYSLCNNLSSLNTQPNGGANSVFSMNSTEAIWQLSTPIPNNDNTNDAQYFILNNAAPSTQTYNSSTISPQLLSSFEAGDRRRVNWIDSFTTASVIYYYPYKYQAYNTSTLTEYTMVLRLAEQYLIRAEAEANLGDSTDAIVDLNTIRNRAGLINYTVINNGPLLNAILHERQIELFTEWGNRWFDLIRTGNINSVMGAPGNVCHAKDGVWNSTSELFPIPQSDILIDPSLTQNPGYVN